MAVSTYTIGGNIQNRRVYKDILIRSGESLSDIVDMGGLHLVQILMGAGWTTAAMTALTGAVSTAMKSLINSDGTEWSWAVPLANLGYDWPNEHILGGQCIQLRSGTLATPVNQATADRTITLVFEEL